MKIEPAVVDLSRIRVSCDRCHLSSLCLPYSLSPSDIAEINKIVKHSHTLRRGDFLFRSGNEFSALYAIRSGSFKVFTYTNDGDEQILGFYFPGEIIGFDAINSNNHFSSALALEASSYCALPFTRLEELSMSIPGLQHRVLQLMSREISHENELVTMLCNKNAEEKVGAFLITLSARFGLLGYSHTHFKLAMSRQDIGNYLGLSVETISRILGRLQKDNIIAIYNKSVKLLDLDRLAGISTRCNDMRIADSCVTPCES